MPRVTDNPNITYKEKTKGKGANKIVDRVIAELKSHPSAIYTKMARKYAQIDRIKKLIEEKRNELNEQAKKDITALFNTEDQVYTRVIDTVSLTLTLAREEEPEEVTDTTVDYEGFMEELYETLPELEGMLKTILDKYTTIESYVPEKKSPALRVKVKPTDKVKIVSADDEDVDESINEAATTSIDKKLKKYSILASMSILRNLRDWDQRYLEFKHQLKNA